MGRFPGEESCLSLVWAVLDLQINNACNGVKLSEIDRPAPLPAPPRDARNRAGTALSSSPVRLAGG